MMKGWKNELLGDLLVKIIGGGTPSKRKSEFWNGDVLWCSVKDMQDDKFIVSNTEDRITELGLNNSSSKLIPKGTVITATRMGLGRAFIAGTDMAINQDLKALIPNEKIDNKFLLWTIVFNRDNLENLGTGSTVKGIRLETLRSLKIHLPPLPTQRKIASILSAYDDLIENNLKRIQLLKEQAQLTYEEWFVRFKFPGHEEVEFVDGLPEGWDVSTLGEFAKTSSGGTPSRRKESEYYENGTIPWVRTGELKKFMLIDSEEYITEMGLKKSSAKLFPEKTVLLAMYGNTIGETTFLTFEASTNQACCAFLVKDKVFKSYFLHQFLLNQKEYILNYRMGAAQENISQGIIQGIKFNRPSNEILIEFEKQIAPKYVLIEIFYKQNQLLKEARDLLLPRLMSGMIGVKELETLQIESL